LFKILRNARQLNQSNGFPRELRHTRKTTAIYQIRKLVNVFKKNKGIENNFCCVQETSISIQIGEEQLATGIKNRNLPSVNRILTIR
jgi:hypothetical protein